MSTTPPPAPVRRQPLVKQVLEYLQQRIASGEFPVGSKLPAEPELMARLTVGRSTLREAMRVLAHMGLVDVRPGDGTYICSPPPEKETLGQRLQRARIFEVYEVRRVLELECARLAALRRDEDDLIVLRQALQQRKAFLAPGHETAFIEADLAFHTGVARATKNTVLSDLYQAFIHVHRESWSQANEVPGLNRQGQELHEQITEAIARRDADQAQDLTRRVLEISTGRIQELLENERQTH
jgi:GntR family transcriptional repressor for pyruvate dehydrogenase complex